MAPMICPADNPAAYTVQVDLKVIAAGSPPAYSFQPTDPSDPQDKHLKNAIGDLDFTDTNQAVAVIINLKDNSGLALQFANNATYEVFSFAKNYNGTKAPIGARHYQFRRVTTDPTGTIVSFCYRNTQNDDDDPHAHHPRSRYGVYLIDPKQNIFPIDPGVGNGGNK